MSRGGPGIIAEEQAVHRRLMRFGAHPEPATPMWEERGTSVQAVAGHLASLWEPGVVHADGVTTRGGKEYRWENLQHLNYVRFHREMSRNVLLRALSKFIFAGVENLKIEMVFTDGMATLAPLIEHQREMLDLMDTIPVRRRSEVRTH